MVNDEEKLEITIYRPGEIQQNVDSFTYGLMRYLKSLGLPSQNVLTNVGERMRVLDNLHSVVESLDGNLRGNSIYISKFTAACSVGLFDAALNFIWDETIASLR